MPTKKKKFDSKFSTAKIKKIMQLDENIGKVASTVPVVISKALEMFLQNFLLDAVNANLKHHTKTLSPQLLKEVTTKDPKWQFLSKVMAPVADFKAVTKTSRPLDRDYLDHSSEGDNEDNDDRDDDVGSNHSGDAPPLPESQPSQTPRLSAKKRPRKCISSNQPKATPPAPLSPSVPHSALGEVQNVKEEIMMDLKKLTGTPLAPPQRSMSLSAPLPFKGTSEEVNNKKDAVPPTKYHKSHSIDTIMGLYSPESCFYSDRNVNKIPTAHVGGQAKNDLSG